MANQDIFLGTANSNYLTTSNGRYIRLFISSVPDTSICDLDIKSDMSQMVHGIVSFGNTSNVLAENIESSPVNISQSDEMDSFAIIESQFDHTLTDHEINSTAYLSRRVDTLISLSNLGNIKVADKKDLKTIARLDRDLQVFAIDKTQRSTTLGCS